MKRPIALPAFVLVLACMLMPNLVHAESVFLNDGSIVEGKVTGTSPTKITVLMPNDLSTTVPRGKILRILRTDEYKRLLEIQLADGSSIKGYIVDQDAAGYTARMELNSAHEFTIEKNRVLRLLYEGSIISPEDIRYSGAEPATPRRAALISLIPFKSGSFLVEGSRVPGISLCILKSVSLLLPLGILVGSMGSPDTSSTSNNTSSPVSTYLKDRTVATLFYAGLGVWAASTIGDMVYSYYRVKNYNANQADHLTGATAPVSLFVVPRAGNTDGRAFAAIDGIDIAFGTRF